MMPLLVQVSWCSVMDGVSSGEQELTSFQLVGRECLVLNSGDLRGTLDLAI